MEAPNSLVPAGYKLLSERRELDKTTYCYASDFNQAIIRITVETLEQDDCCNCDEGDGPHVHLSSSKSTPGTSVRTLPGDRVERRYVDPRGNVVRTRIPDLPDDDCESCQ